jgi:hypothetical protein
MIDMAKVRKGKASYARRQDRRIVALKNSHVELRRSLSEMLTDLDEMHDIRISSIVRAKQALEQADRVR